MGSYGELDGGAQRELRTAVRRLEKIPVGGSPQAVFDALRVCAPVAGGLIGAMRAEMTGSMISHVVGLPGDVLEAWATTPQVQLRRMMAPLLPAPLGELISDRTEITGAFREQLDLIRVMRSAGLGESAGYKVATGTNRGGQPEHSFLTLALEGGASLTASQRHSFRLLQPTITAALARIAVPLLPCEPIFAQIVEERRIGYMCLSNRLAVVELNDRIHELARHYLQVAHVEPGRGWLARFAERVLRKTAGNQVWHLVHPDEPFRVEISAYQLAQETDRSDRALTLIMVTETATLPPANVTERERQIAHRLVTTGGSYQEIADSLGIAEGTMRKHVERVYRGYGVRSRPELTSKRL